MTAISGVAASPIPQTPARVGGTDSDGDKDGSKSAAANAPAAPAPAVSKPTDTLGNNVNTFA
ncbi:hypothetical protein [Rhodoferax sp. GW822-FHT02A01]|uniref:hypothetical protein n=1 Tax=Rhodoferax sp. GW822-FHT02A01 TaxID=3141537 RepID=UPI00315D456D